MKRFQKRLTAILLALLMVLSIIPATVLSAAADVVDTSTATFTVYAVELNTVYLGKPVDLSAQGQLLASGKKLSEILPNVSTLRENATTNYSIANPFLVFALEEDGTLEGDYTMPAYTSILVPHDAANTYYTVYPGDVTMTEMMNKGLVPKKTSGMSQEQWMGQAMYTLLQNTKPYKTLTVNGEVTFSAMSQMSVGAYYYAGNVRDSSLYKAGMPSNAILGPYGLVTLGSNAKLDFTANGIEASDIDALSLPDIEDSKPPVPMNKGSYLFAWGFVNGEGTVNIQNGANVYEDFQLSDFPDLETAMAMMTRDEERQLNGVFPVSQYYVQNIESNMNVYEGGTEKIHACLSLGTKKVPIEVPFVGGEDSGSMFIVKSGYVTKYFEPSPVFKTKFIINGGAAISTLSMNLAGLADISSSDFQLPITNIDIEVTDTSTLEVTQDLQLLPYASITVDDGATLDVQSVIYVVDAPKEGDDRTYPGVRDVMLLSTSEGLGLNPANPSSPFTNSKPVNDENGAQLIVNGTVTVQDMGEEKPAGIAYVGDEAISGGGTIINYSPYEVPAMNVMSAQGQATTEEAQLEAVVTEVDEEGKNIIYTADPDEPVGYKYSSEYKVWYIEGEPICISFWDMVVYDDEGNRINEPEVFSEDVYEFGEEIDIPDDPVRAGDEIYTSYTFKGWKSTNPAALKNGEPASNAIATTIYIADYEVGNLREYEVTFKDTDDTILQATQSLPYGSHVEFTGTTPTPPSATKVQDGWTAYYPDTDETEVVNASGDPLKSYYVTQNVIFRPRYVDKNYVVTWKNSRPNGEETTTSGTYSNPSRCAVNRVKFNYNYSDDYYDYAVSGWTYSAIDVLDQTEKTGEATLSGNYYTVPVYGDTTCTPIYTATPKSGVNPFIRESLTLNGEIGANCLIQLPDGAEAADYSVDFSWGNNKSFTDTSLAAYPGSRAVATVDVAPKEMMDTITATLKKNGATVATHTYHVADYAVSVINDKDKDNDNIGDVTEDLTEQGYSADKIQKLKALCYSILFYGRQAQTQFNYTSYDAEFSSVVNTLLNDYSPSEDPHTLIPGGENTCNVYQYGLEEYVGSTLQLNSKTTYAIFFKVSDVSLASEVTATAKINGKNQPVTCSLVNSTNGQQDAYLRIDIEDIAARDITENITVVINGSVNFTPNAGAYIKNALSCGDPTLIDTVTALYNFNQKAIAYFGA